MKHVKLFEQFINEANEEILAQGACKNAIFMAQKSVDALLKKMESAGLISKAKTKVEVYNRGYELISKYEYDWRKTAELGDDAASMIMTLQSSIWLQPGTFFERKFEEGSAKIEGRAFKTSLSMSYEDHYPNYIVKSKADIKKVQKEFSDLIKGQCDEIAKTLGL